MTKAPALTEPVGFVSYDANTSTGFNIGDYTDWNAAYRFLNDRLFEGGLPEVVFTLQRRAGSKGYASQGKFTNREDGGKLDELAMNPDLFLERTDRETLSTLAHEMATSGSTPTARPTAAATTTRNGAAAWMPSAWCPATRASPAASVPARA